METQRVAHIIEDINLCAYWKLLPIHAIRVFGSVFLSISAEFNDGLPINVNTAPPGAVLPARIINDRSGCACVLGFKSHRAFHDVA